MKKLFLLFALAVGLFTSASTLQAQTVNMNRYITLNVKRGASIKLNFYAAAAGTHVRIISGLNFKNITVGTGWIGMATYTAGSTTMTVYGDITGFSCSENYAKLTAIDLSQNTQLKELNCGSNNLTTLDVSGCTPLEQLNCSSNQLTSLDVSHNTQLTELGCSYNQLSSLDVSGCTQLEWLNCRENNLTSLDVSGYTQLERLNCYSNRLTTLDVSGCTQLKILDCYNNNLTTLDVSGRTQLTELGCYNNNLTTLDVSGCTQLEMLYCDNNNLTTLDVSGRTQLERLDCYNNNLTTLDVSGCTQLKELWCHGNNFNTTALDRIYCALPDRTSKTNGVIYPLKNSSDPNHATVLATNAQNATSKNWGVKYSGVIEKKKHSNIPATTGSYVCPVKYNLRIAGVQVTSDNCSDLSVIPDVSGTVKYDPSTKTLTLQNATIQTNTSTAIESSIDGLTIKVIGTNNLTTEDKVVFYLYDPLTITGGGVLSANSGTTSAIFARETNLTIDGCTVNAKSKYGIAGYYGSSEMLTIKNSTVTAEGTYGSIVYFAGLTLDGCAITQPAGAAFDASLNAVALGGAVVKSKVVISPITTYDLWITGVQVTSANCSNLSVISGVSGTVKYDPTNKVLTLDGATIQKTNTYAAIESSIDGLTIKVIGTNNLMSTLRVNRSATITGGGTLNVEIQDYSAIYVNETNLTIDGCTVNAKGKYGITGYDGSSETLTIKNSTVTAEGINGSITDFASLTLDGCAITQPAGAAFDASLKAVALGGAKVTSKVVISPTGVGEPNMSRYITLTVKSGEDIKLDLAAAAAATPVRIVSGSNTQNITVGTSWTGIATYTTRGTEMKVYGDLIGFDCSGNGANLTALDVSHNTQLRKLYCRDNSLSSLNVSKNTELIGLYCYGNSFSTSALDDIYCALPVRSASDNARIVPVESASAPNHATVLATNAQNATAKNWKVLYAEDNADVPTTGKHKCSATDIAEVSAEPALTLYPNPVADVLYLSATARTIRVYDIYGTEVAHATDTDRVEVSHLPAGVYTVRADGTVAKMVKR